jgi:hypothetical protein
MAATLEELDELEKAIRSGILSARDRSGRLIQYRSLEDMRSARDEMRRELGLDPIKGSRRRVWIHNRGT